MKKKKPQPEQITVKGVSVTIYSTPSFKDGKEYPAWTLSYTEAGKRIRRSVANLDKARSVARSIAGQLASGTGHAHALTPAELSDYQGAIRILRQAPGIHLTTAASTFAQAWATFPDTGDILAAVRHSFASYRLAVVKSADQVALEMGNSPTKLFQNYREIVTEPTAATWFSIVPEPPGEEKKLLEFAA